MIALSKCTQCARTFPEHLVQPLMLSHGARDPEPRMVRMCPMCALKLRNELHGLPADAPFQGPKALQLHREAVEYLKMEETK